jgi:hypothetical protein
MDNKKKLSREEQSEIKKLKKDVKNDLKIMQQVKVPHIQIAHLERILRFYKRIHAIDPPSAADKMTIGLLKLQYRGMCAVTRTKPERDIL